MCVGLGRGGEGRAEGEKEQKFPRIYYVYVSKYLSMIINQKL